MNDKDTGSFYTPNSLVDYMVSYIQSRVNPSSILEPSAGDGRFVRALKGLNAPITLVENDKEKIVALQNSFADACQVHGCDFIDYSLREEKSYDLIIGNPPYIPKKKLPDNQVNASLKLIESFALDKGTFQNLWVSFVLASIKLLSYRGVLFFVLPFEFLQVQYAEKLRAFLENRFNTIEIVTFEDRLFEDIEQDVCLVYMTNEAEAKPYVQYSTLKNVTNPKPLFQSKIMRNKPLKKWSNCILSDDETEALLQIAKQFPVVKNFGEISPGIVTGANGFFILPRQEIDSLNIPEGNKLPIVLKSSSIPPLLLFCQQDFNALLASKKPTHMLNTNTLAENQFSPELLAYLNTGLSQDIHKRYKCACRSRWFDVPVVKNGSAWFFKRYHNLPRLIVNLANIHSTDIAYNIRFSGDYDAASFAFSFYNSLTLALCEYCGRYYGGGVGELVPSEFKSLHIPYRKIPEDNVHHLDDMLRNGCKVVDIIDYVDNVVLGSLNNSDRTVLQKIRQRYIDRRMKMSE